MCAGKLPWSGGCMCGRVRFRVGMPPILTMACHCSGCQRLSASAFSLTVAVPGAGFAVTQGDLVAGGMHGPHQQLYCADCKNWIVTRPAGIDYFVNVRATMLDDHAWYEPFIEVHTSEKLAWAATPAAHSFADQPEMRDYARLTAEFERDGRRPA